MKTNCLTANAFKKYWSILFFTTDEMNNVYDVVLQAVTLLGGAIAIWISILIWRILNKIKRSDFLETQ